MNKNKILCCIFLLLLSNFASAQITDNNEDGYDDKTGWNSDNTFNIQTGECVADCTVPSDFKGAINPKGSFTLNGATYDTSSGAKVTVSNGEITEFQGTLNSESLLGGVLAKGNIIFKNDLIKKLQRSSNRFSQIFSAVLRNPALHFQPHPCPSSTPFEGR